MRYYGLEALYNIAKNSRDTYLRFFSDTFDALFRLCADSATRVQNASMILDNQIKVWLQARAAHLCARSSTRLTLTTCTCANGA